MGQLKVNVAGVWLPVGSGGGGSDEVAIGPDDPIVTVPSTELWYDTDDVAVMTDDVRWNTAWGVVASVSQPATQTFSALAITDVTGLTVTWTPIVGRRYLTTLNVLARKITATGDISVLLADGPTGIMCIGSVMSLGANGYGPTTMQYIDTPATAVPITRKAQVHPGTASAVTSPVAGYACTIVVEDIGPATGAVAALPSPAGCRLRRVAALAVPTGGASIDIPFDTEDADTHGFFAPTSTVITIPAGMAGLYEISGQIVAAANTGTICYTDVKLNGTVIQRIPAAANASPPFPSFLMNLAVGNTITIAINQSSGGSVNFTASMIMRFMGVL